jgi:hypothetical protein
MIDWLQQEYESIFEDGLGQMTVSQSRQSQQVSWNDFGLHHLWPSEHIDVQLHQQDHQCF